MKNPVPVIVLAQLFGTSLWFSANSAADDLIRTWGIAPADIGTLTNAVTVQVRAYIDGDILKVNATNTFHQGSLQPQMKLLFDLEKVFNFATGHLFRSGNQRKYDDFMKLALQQAVEKSGEKLSRRITVAGGKAFNYRAEYTRMEMTPTGAVLKVGMSATIPDSVVCEVRAALNEMNGFKCTAPVTRGR